MNVLENAARSISGSVDKAILCIRKSEKAKNSSKKGASVSSKSPLELQADLISQRKNGMFSFINSSASVIQQSGYHVLKVKYNPSSISIGGNAGINLQPGPGGAGTNGKVQLHRTAEISMDVELLFDEVNAQDAFMFDKFTNISAGGIISDGAGAVKNIAGEGYTVRPIVESFLGMLTQSETKQVVFYWNKMSFAGEITSVNASYTMFNQVGNPIRASVKLSIVQAEGSKDNKGNNYWENAFDQLGTGRDLLQKAGNVINLR